MFTGLVQAMGTVRGLRPRIGGAPTRLVVHSQRWDHVQSAGDSICVSGVCLTLLGTPSEFRVGILAFDVVEETLAKTTLGGLAPGDRVNLEHAVRADTLMGGHFVQGHVEGVGVVERVWDAGGDLRVTIRPGRDLMDAIVPKGSVCVDGVSLTVARVEGEAFDVALIPTTLAQTTLSGLRAGTRVNIETDMIARTVVNFLRRREAGVG